MLELDLPDKFQHYQEFKELINIDSKSAEFIFFLTAHNMLFPDQIFQAIGKPDIIRFNYEIYKSELLHFIPILKNETKNRISENSL